MKTYRFMICFILSILLAVGMIPFSAAAETEYPLVIAGVQVTSSNRNDVLGDGVFSYDGAGVLTIDGDCTYTAGNILVNWTGEDELIVSTVSDSTLSAKIGIDAVGPLTVTGSGKLTVKTDISPSIGLRCRAGLTVKDADLEVYAAAPIQALSDDVTPFLFLRANVIAESISDYRAFDGTEKDFAFVGCGVSDPGACYAVWGYLGDSDADPFTRVVIDRDTLPNVAPLIAYDLTIAGINVTELNKDDILRNGVFSFDGFGTLTVNGTCIAYQSVIFNEIEGGLTIDVQSDSEFGSTHTHTIQSVTDLTITGRGELFINAHDENCGIRMLYGASLTIDRLGDLSAECEGAYALCGDSGEETLTINATEVYMSGSESAITGFGGGITLENLHVASPALFQILNGSICDVTGTRAVPAKTVWLESLAANAYDLNCDGTADIGDVTALLDVLSTGNVSSVYDLNSDGVVDIGDVTALLDALSV